MPVERNRKPERFTTLDNDTLERGDMSWQAKGLLCYLLSRPDNWRVSVEHLAKYTSTSERPTRRDGVYGLLNELSKLGYVERRVVRDGSGKMNGYDYIVHDSPYAPFPAQPFTAQPFTAQTTLTNTERATKTDIDKPAPAKAGAKCTFAEFSKMCEDAGEKRIQPDDPVFADMAAAGIPAEYLALHWRWFVLWAGEIDAKGKERKYAGTRGWRQVFRKSVRECWSKLWWKDNKSGQWCLTQAGIMAQAAQNNGRE